MAYLMLIFSKIADLEGYLSQIRSKNRSIGFVPTMGALHKGHLSLIKASKKECDYTICSIFVNPTQFNDKADLERYPRMPEKDAKLLQEGYCDALFLPEVDEIYPKSQVTSHGFDFGNLDKVLEGKYRPGHFKGVAQVVKRFFEIVKPDKAFFGSKDYQQVMVVKELVKQMKSPIEIVSCPILRETDGLAMSSRNALLSSQEREIASIIPKLLKNAKGIALDKSIEASKNYVRDEISKVNEIKLDYFEVCDGDTLIPINSLTESKKPVALIAAFVGKIRLIDNMSLSN